MRVLLLILVALIWHFSQNFWLSGIWFAKAQETQASATQASVIAVNNTTPATDGSGLMFGKYESGEVDVVEVVEEDLFDEKNQAYIGQLGNYKYILYATAKQSGKVSAKLLVNDLELETVDLITVTKSSVLNDAKVVSIDLSKLTMAQGPNSIELKLFERSK